MLKTVALAAVIAVFTPVVAPAPASAQQAWQVGGDTMRLYNRDLDMNKAADRAALLARVERAAMVLCRDTGDERACARAAVDATMQGPAAAPLRLAMTERGGVRVASR